MIKKLLFIATLYMSCTYSATAQIDKNPALTADSLASGNYKDVLNSFFQLTFDRFTSDNKELRFVSNPFAVMAKMDTMLLQDDKYYKYRHLRDLNFGFGAALDNSYKFNGFSSSVKYALINQRDETVSRAFLVSVANNYKTKELFALNDSLTSYISTLPSGIQLTMNAEKVSFIRGDVNFSQLSDTLKNKILAIAKGSNFTNLNSLLQQDENFNIKAAGQQTYDSIKANFNNRLLWTVGLADTTYQNQFLFSNVVLSTELLKGISNPAAPINSEITLRSYWQFLDDSLKTGRDLKRSVFSVEPGVNFILKAKETGKSFLEFKLSGSYYHTFSTLYEGEEKNRLTLNSTLRFRVMNDIWIPLEIKYDPATGNVFGFLNVRFNFTGQNKLANSK